MQITQHLNFLSLLKAPALLIFRHCYHSPGEGIPRALLMEKLYKMGPSPQQVQADLNSRATAELTSWGMQECFQADLGGKLA